VFHEIEYFQAKEVFVIKLPNRCIGIRDLRLGSGHYGRGVVNGKGGGQMKFYLYK
jgi:hypothetical protein